MTKQRTPSASLWLPHRSFSLLSNCLITRHRLFAKSKSKLNRRLKLALAKLAMILIIIIIERVGRASTAGTSRARTGSAGSKKPSTSGCRRGRQQLANLCSSLVSSVPQCLIAFSSPHRRRISTLGLSVCAQLLSLPIEMGSTNRREILEHSSGWRRKRNCSGMGEEGGAEGSVFFVLLKTLAASEKENPFEIVCRFERRANFLRSFLGLIIIHCIEKA